MTHPLQSTIDLAWEARASLSPGNSPEIRAAVDQVIAGLDAGEIRVAERQGVGEWTVNQWVKKAVLLSFRLSENRMMEAGRSGPAAGDAGARRAGLRPATPRARISGAPPRSPAGSSSSVRRPTCS